MKKLLSLYERAVSLHIREGKKPFVISFLMLFLLLVSFNVQSQTVSGKVTDETGKPISGASIRIKGNAQGVMTDASGDFKINAPAAAILVVSYVGYVEMEVAASSTLANLRLKPLNKDLDDVIVVGYGKQKKTTLTGAVEQVTAKAFESRAVTNVGLALQGMTPGLVVTRSSPRPGNEGLAFQIRGATSVNGGSPLVVIDGVPALYPNVFQNMNSDDIESISVLKDGAAAIYGSRAANGVILVTTKRGNGKVKVDYSGNFRFTTNGITSYSPNMQQYATLWIDANKEETTPNWWGWVDLPTMQRMQQGIEGIYTTQFWGNIFLGNANRISEMFAQRYSYQHNISISNRTDVSGYRLSFAYADNQSTLATAYDGQKQYNLRFNYDYKLSNRIKLESAVTLQNVHTSGPSFPFNDGANSIFAYDVPFFPAKNPYGQWYADFGTVGDRNAAAATSDGGRDDKNSLTGRLDLKGTVQILKDLSFEGLVSFQNDQYRQERYVIPVQTYDWYGNKASQVIAGTLQTTSNPGYATTATTTFYQYYSALLKYNKTLKGHHNISVVGGINAEKNEYKALSASRVNFTDQGVYDLNVATTSTLGNSGGKNQTGFYSYLARVNYNYAEKYLLEMLGRVDGASQFDNGYKFKNFGTASLGWVFTKENISKNITSIINFGKIRASYGVAGNNVGIGNYDYVTAVNNGNVVLGLPAVQQASSALSGNGLISRDRTWEKVYQKNIGIDLTFLRNRLSATFDYFVKQNKGMLTNVQYPSVLGGTAPKTNSGELTVKGWEAIVSWKDQKGKFSYNISFNISDNHSYLNLLQGADTYVAGKNATVNGYPLNSWFLYQTAGYFQSQAEVDSYIAKYTSGSSLGDLAKVYTGATRLRPGDTKRVDLSGDGVISSAGGNVKSNTSDLKFMGDGNQHFVFGLNLGAAWNGFDFNAFFQGVAKQYIMRTGYGPYPFYTIYTNQNATFLGKTWTATNTGAEYPRLSVYPDRANWNYQNNDFMLQNSRYIRLKSLIVGYTLPQKISRRAHIDRLRVYFSGNDLWEATSIKDGWDPEVGSNQNGGFPFYRTWSFGVNIGL